MPLSDKAAEVGEATEEAHVEAEEVLAVVVATPSDRLVAHSSLAALWELPSGVRLGGTILSMMKEKGSSFGLVKKGKGRPNLIISLDRLFLVLGVFLLKRDPLLFSLVMEENKSPRGGERGNGGNSLQIC